MPETITQECIGVCVCVCVSQRGLVFERMHGGIDARAFCEQDPVSFAGCLMALGT